MPGSSADLNVKNIQRCVLIMGHQVEQISDVPCGNTCGLVGIDQYVIKTCTITEIESAHNIVQMKYSVSPVVRIAVRTKDGKDLPKLVDGLKQLAKSDPLVVCSHEESGEHVIAGCGELHVEICLKDLRDDYCKGVEILTSDPVVSYRETVQEESSEMALAKSPNKHNRLYMKAEPLAEELVVEIEAGAIGSKSDPKERAKTYQDKYDWDPNHAKKVWCFGPDTSGANVVVDATSGVQFMNEIKDSVNSAFQWATKEGPLCEENMRGIRFNILDVTMHADAIHRGQGQMMPAARRCMYAAQLLAKPTLQEPIFLVEITCPQDAMSGVYNCLNLRRGHVFEENQRPGTPIVMSRAFLPVAESFGFTSALRQATSGQAFPQCVFSHWEVIMGDPLEIGSKAQELVLGVRKRKNIKVEMPLIADFNEKL